MNWLERIRRVPRRTSKTCWRRRSSYAVSRKPSPLSGARCPSAVEVTGSTTSSTSPNGPEAPRRAPRDSGKDTLYLLQLHGSCRPTTGTRSVEPARLCDLDHRREGRGVPPSPGPHRRRRRREGTARAVHRLGGRSAAGASLQLGLVVRHDVEPSTTRRVGRSEGCSLVAHVFTRDGEAVRHRWSSDSWSSASRTPGSIRGTSTSPGRSGRCST